MVGTRSPRLLTCALVVAAAAFARPAESLENPVAGEWTLEGTDEAGAYGGTARVSRLADGRVSIALFPRRQRGQGGRAMFVGSWKGAELSGARSKSPGIAGVLGDSPRRSVPETFLLSADGTKLTGTFGSSKETLARTLPPEARIVILHTNDVHGQVVPLVENGRRRGGYPALVARLRKERAAALAAGAAVITLDGGDIYAGTPEGDQTQGKVALDAMNLAGYDAGAIGNHEFDQGLGVVKALVERAAFPILGANLRDGATQRQPAWKNFGASARLSAHGLQVCVVGLITSTLQEVTIGAPGLVAEPEEAAVAREVAANKDADLFILLTHVGQAADLKLAQRFAGRLEGTRGRLAVVVGAHTHDAIQSPKRIPDGPDGVLVAQAGKLAQWLGRVELVVERASGRLLEASGKLIPVRPEEGEADDIARVVERGSGEITRKMDAKIGDLTAPLGKVGKGSSPIGSLLCDLTRAHARAEVAFLNKTAIRAGLDKGDVRLREIYQVSPFAASNFVFTLSGAELRAAVEGSLAPEIGTPPALEVSGIVVRYDPRRQAGRRAQSILVNGAPLDETRRYTVATTKFLASGGDGHETFTLGRDVKEDPVDLLSLLGAHFKGRTITPERLEQRWVDVSHP